MQLTFFTPVACKNAQLNTHSTLGACLTPLKFTNCPFTPKIGVKFATFSNEEQNPLEYIKVSFNVYTFN